MLLRRGIELREDVVADAPVGGESLVPDARHDHHRGVAGEGRRQVARRRYRIDAAELYRRTGGNPFFVSEVLAAGTDQIPGTVRDAVLARAATLDATGRMLLEALAVIPAGAELGLLRAIAGDAAEGIIDVGEFDLLHQQVNHCPLVVGT